MQNIQQDILRIFPTLGFQSTKGENGTIGIIGGSYEYTGAPYYAAISALKVGADLVHIFCSKSAAGPIKTYSPEIIVHPIFVSSDELDEELSQEALEKMHEKWLSKLSDSFSRINSWVIGPGLGRDKYMKSFYPKLISSFPSNTILVIDADGLYFLCQFPQLLPKLSDLRTILTPNHRQFKHLNQIINLNEKQIQQDINTMIGNNQINVTKSTQTCKYTVVRKGQIDQIITTKSVYRIMTKGGMKRCGGIGDILAGIMATCCFWDQQYGPALACHITKLIARKAFQSEGRSLTAPAIIQKLKQTISQLQSPQIKPSI